MVTLLDHFISPVVEEAISKAEKGKGRISRVRVESQNNDVLKMVRLLSANQQEVYNWSFCAKLPGSNRTPWDTDPYDYHVFHQVRGFGGNYLEREGQFYTMDEYAKSLAKETGRAYAEKHGLELEDKIN